MVQPRHALVLVVERDEALRLSTARVLESAGYEVHAAADVPDALAAASVRCPDLVLVHVGLADGWSFVRALRTDPRTSGCPIVATGGRPIAEHAHEPMLAEVEAYLHKPSEPDFLFAVLVGVLGGGGVAERARRIAQESNVAESSEPDR